MNNNLTTTIEKIEEEKPASDLSLKELNDFLTNLKKEYPELRRLQAYDYEEYICILVGDLPSSLKSKLPHEAFRIYPDNEVADNFKHIESKGYGKLHLEVRDFLKNNGFIGFHNPYVGYIDKRTYQRIADEKTL